MFGKNYSQINENSFADHLSLRVGFDSKRKCIKKRRYPASNFSQGRKTQVKRVLLTFTISSQSPASKCFRTRNRARGFLSPACTFARGEVFSSQGFPFPKSHWGYRVTKGYITHSLSLFLPPSLSFSPSLPITSNLFLRWIEHANNAIGYVHAYIRAHLAVTKSLTCFCQTLPTIT